MTCTNQTGGLVVAPLNSFTVCKRKHALLPPKSLKFSLPRGIKLYQALFFELSHPSPLPLSYPLGLPNRRTLQEATGSPSWGVQPVQGLTLRRVPHLVECSAVPILKFLVIFEQGALHLHSALNPANYVASPGQKARMMRNSEDPEPCRVCRSITVSFILE